ncbi:uncharacterized protein V1518DRAFT_422748 [Limtongia smithiae]|uniref:uncharacterized protein n=1 Tax=Limtongia smithiae TaxID=1125753 RepID=UPI0034CFB22D
MPPFRDEVIFVISTGSQYTRVQYGLPESLTPAQTRVPTKVYRIPSAEKNDPQFVLDGMDESVAVYPIVEGEIVDLAALQYLMETLYKRAIKSAPDVLPYSPVLFTCNAEWRPQQIEALVNHMFTHARVPAITTIPESLSAVFAHALDTALVVNIGASKTEITPVVEYTIADRAVTVLHGGVGGDAINAHLAQLLPSFTPGQVEALKRSNIYEILVDKSVNHFFGEPNAPPSGHVGLGGGDSLEDEGIVDVVAIVASGNAREVLAQREQQKRNAKLNEPVKRNAELARNSFIDASSGRTIEVGTERFHGAEELIERIALGVWDVINKIDEIPRRGECWENIILVGGPTAIKGFTEYMLLTLQERFMVNRAVTFSEMPSGFNTPGINTPPPPMTHSHMLPAGHGQVPTNIRIAKMADYFIGWKGHSWEDAQFLGSQIAAKQIFTPGIANIDGGYVSREDYAERGAKEIWNLTLF